MNKVIKFDLTNLMRNYGRRDIEIIVHRLPQYLGDSYILNYKKLVAQSKRLKCLEVHLLNYVVLASFRSFYNYKTQGDNTLDAALCPLSDKEVINNPFINRYGGKIHFLLEPSPTGPLHGK